MLQMGRMEEKDETVFCLDYRAIMSKSNRLLILVVEVLDMFT